MKARDRFRPGDRVKPSVFGRAVMRGATAETRGTVVGFKDDFNVRVLCDDGTKAVAYHGSLWEKEK